MSQFRLRIRATNLHANPSCFRAAVALEQQKREYERQFEQLRSAMSPSAPGPLGDLDGGRRGSSLYSPLAQSRLEQWARDRSVSSGDSGTR